MYTNDMYMTISHHNNNVIIKKIEGYDGHYYDLSEYV